MKRYLVFFICLTLLMGLLSACGEVKPTSAVEKEEENNKSEPGTDVKNNEEQMCGYLNINEGLYGECYVYVTDINDNRGEFALRKITGCDKNSNFDMSRNRFSGFEDKNGWYNSYIFRESEREIQEASAEKPQKSSRNSDYER